MDANDIERLRNFVLSNPQLAALFLEAARNSPAMTLQELAKTAGIDLVKTAGVAVIGKKVIEATVEKAAVTAGAAATAATMTALKESLAKTAVYGATGLILKKSIPHVPGFFNKVLDNLGRGGYERGVQSGQLAVITAVTETIKNAGLMEALSYMNQLADYNPNLKSLKTIIIYAGAVGVSVKALDITATLVDSMITRRNNFGLAKSKLGARLDLLGDSRKITSFTEEK